MIKLEDVSKIYKIYETPLDRLKESFFKKRYHTDFNALSNVSISIEKGEVLGIVGQNGSGKSTLLKIISKVLTPSSGIVDVRGRVAALLELGAGFNPELSGLENIKLNLSLMNVDANIEEIVRFADIGEFIDRPLKMYSSGMKARVGFALSIHVDPDILIVDEALSVGDAAFQRKCFSKIEQFCKHTQKIVIFVSHSIGSIVNLSSRVMWLSRGKIILDGDPKSVTNLYMKYQDSKAISPELLKKIKKQYLKMSSNNTTLVVPIKKELQPLNKSFFNKNLVSKSKVAYGTLDAEISNIKIVDLQGNSVNTLYYAQEYIFSYEVEFKEAYYNIEFAMFLKSIEGIMISGRGERYIKEHNAGKRYFVKWHFKAMLNREFYLFNCAVNSYSEGKKVTLHRVVDAILFQVIKEEKNSSYGLVDMGMEFKMEAL